MSVTSRKSPRVGEEDKRGPTPSITTPISVAAPAINPIDIRQLLGDLKKYPYWRRNALVTLLPPTIRIGLKALLAGEPQEGLFSVGEMIGSSWSTDPVRPMTWKERRAPRPPKWFSRIFSSRSRAEEETTVIPADELGVVLWDFLARNGDYADYVVASFARHSSLTPSDIRVEVFILDLVVAYFAVGNQFDLGMATAVYSWLLTAVEAFSTGLPGTNVFVPHVRVRQIRRAHVSRDLQGGASRHTAISGEILTYGFLQVFDRMPGYAGMGADSIDTGAPSDLFWTKHVVEVLLRVLKNGGDPAATHTARLATAASHSRMVDVIKRYQVLPVSA